MATMKNNNEILYGVGCDVVNCKYHGQSDRCFADSIMVESQNAVKKAETFCGTFTPRTQIQH